MLTFGWTRDQDAGDKKCKENFGGKTYVKAITSEDEAGGYIFNVSWRNRL
jgi:hypothetical protein